MQDKDELTNLPNQDEQEIDIIELSLKLWNARKLLIKWVAAGIVVGLVVAFSIPKEYTTTVTLAAEVTDGKRSTGGLSSLASLAGINMSSSTEGIGPVLYPDIVSSMPFTVDLLDVKVKTRDDEEFTVIQFIEDETSSPWWVSVISLPFKALGAVMSLFRDEEEFDPDAPVNYYQLNHGQMRTVDALSKRIEADVDDKTGIITVNVTMQDPLVAAMLADTVVQRLQDVVTDYRTNKARVDLDFAQRINDEARESYHEAQSRYAYYIDRNHSITLKSGQVEMERLQNEASLAFNLYNQTAQQLQAARAKVQELAPVYTTIQPATVPVKPSKPSRPMILVGFVFMAFVFGAAWVLYGQTFVNTIKEKHANKSESVEETEQEIDLEKS